jgi:hypothetical protein
MPKRPPLAIVRAGLGLAAVLVLAACTAGGQFDPTEVLSTDIFETKKKLQGEREPLFPNGVPGTETGVPPDLVKGYQPPPEPVAVQNNDAAAKPAAASTAAAKPQPKPKPQVARAPASAAGPPARSAAHDPVWDQKGTAPPPPAKSAWPAPPPGQPAQTNWPAPPPPAQPAQTNWPAPPAAQSQQPAASAQTNWPNPPSSAH